MTELTAPTPYRRSGPGPTFAIGLNLCLLGIYTNFAVKVGGSFAPGVPVVAGAILLLPHMVSNKRSLLWLGWLFIFLTVSLVAGGSGAEFFGDRLPSWFQIVVALSCAHIILCAMNYPEKVRKILFIWLMFIVVGIILETVFSPLRDLSNEFRNVVFEGRFIYAGDARDLQDYGFVRPKLFTQEPSHVAKAFIVFGAGWYVLSSSRRRLGVLLICTVLVTVFLGSPFGLLVLPVAWLLSRMASKAHLFKLFAAGIPVVGLIAIALTQLFSARFEKILSGTDASFFSRFQGPYEVALGSLEQYPIFGVGIGAKEALQETVLTAYGLYFGSRSNQTWLSQNYLTILSNGFANSISFFGLAGAAVFFILLAQWMKGFGITAAVSLPVILLFFQLDGAFEGLRMWGSLAVILGCYLMASRCSPQRVETSTITSGAVETHPAVR